MPELPEVETVINTLKTVILKEQIKDVKVYYDKMIHGDYPLNSLIDEHFVDILRKGKYIIFVLDNYYLLSHLRMEGKFFIKDKTAEKDKHTHVIFYLSNCSLRYNDVRKFGIMQVIPKSDNYLDYINVGLDPFVDNLTAAYVYKKRANKPVKTFLLDQTVICGIGNIYADEICFACKLNPMLNAKDLTMSDCENIVNNTKTILSKAIELGGSTIRSYTSSLGVTGRFQQELMVHTRDGKPCYICGNKILKTKVGGRGTYYCPHCQEIKHFVVAVTGGIACGKSYLLNKLKSYEIISLDETNRSLLEKGEAIYQVLTKNYDILDSEGNIDKKRLKKIIFSSQPARERVNNLTHPLIKQALQKQIASSKRKVIFVEIPLFFESPLSYCEDLIVCVYTDKKTQLRRLMKRDNISKQQADKMIKSQLDIEYKKQHSDVLIDTTNKDSLEKGITNLMKKLGAKDAI